MQVLVLLVLARGAGELLRRLGQAPIVGEILVGVLLGPTLLGRAFPELHATLFPPDAVQAQHARRGVLVRRAVPAPGGPACTST